MRVCIRIVSFMFCIAFFLGLFRDENGGVVSKN